MDDPFPALELLAIINFSNIDASLIAELFALLLLLASSALVSGSEVAFFSLNPQQLETLKDDTNPKFEVIQKLISDPKKLLATILISNNFVNVAFILLSTNVNKALFQFKTIDIQTSLFETSISAGTQAFVFDAIIIAFVILVLGEVLPKVYASKYPLQLASITGKPLSVLEKVFSVGSNLLITSTNFIDRKIQKKSSNISVDDLSQALELTSNENTDEEEQKILEGIVRFGSTDVKQVMTPRIDFSSINSEITYLEVLESVMHSGFSRIPVYSEQVDKIIGILFSKDLLPHLNKKGDFNWHSLLRDPYYVPENKKIDDLLKEFQQLKTHMAIVVDEYGGASGLITLEDILEEIVGEISDEFDDDDLVYSKLDAFNYIFEGKTALKDMYKVIGIDGEDFEKAKGESDSIAGFILEQAGKILNKNERLKFNDYTFTIEEADRRRIKSVKLTLKPKV